MRIFILPNIFNYFILAWEDEETIQTASSNKLINEEDIAADGVGKGHTNLIGDSSLQKDIKQSQKKMISSSGGKPVLQFIRQSVGRIPKDNEQKDKDYRIIENLTETKASAFANESSQDTFLAAGNAERAFFSVCMEGNSSELPVPDNRTNYSIDIASKQETTSLDSKYSDNDEEKAKSIKVVNEILGEIEIDHQRQQLENDINQIDTNLININDTENKYSKSNTSNDRVDAEETSSQASFRTTEPSNILTNEEKTSEMADISITQNNKSDQSITDGPLNSRAIARSLVVDIHIPPNEDEHFLISEMNSKPIESTSGSAFSRKDDTSFRPCKHEVNRSQRCYSDTSHLDKKRKYKVIFSFEFFIEF